MKQRKQPPMTIETGAVDGNEVVFLTPTMALDPDRPVRVYLGDDLIYHGRPGVDPVEVGWENADRITDGGTP